MRPSPPAPARTSVIGVRQPPARKLANLTAARALRTLEVLVPHAASPPPRAPLEIARLFCSRRSKLEAARTRNGSGVFESGTGRAHVGT